MDARLTDALTWLRSQEAAMEDDLAALVSINSFTEHREGGIAVGSVLQAFYARAGLLGTRVPSVSGCFADHWVFHTPSKKPISIGLIGHLDTVFPPGGFEGYRRDGVLARGPGVLDMKGGLVVVGYALWALAYAELLPEIALSVVVVADEEVGSPEGQEVLRAHLAGAKSALVFEAGRANDAIITQRKGTGGLTVRAQGKAAHAGNLHHEGVNAIWALARFIDEAQRLTQYDAGCTVNVGKVSGGQSKNTVPDTAEAQVDLRFCTHAQLEALLEGLHIAAEHAERDIPGARVTLSISATRPPLGRSGASASLAAAYGACAREEGLGSLEAPLLGGGSDANTTSAMGIASIDGLGPRGKGFHTQEEQIEVATLVPKAAALVRFLYQTTAYGAGSLRIG